jgi:hypothetical protein
VFTYHPWYHLSVEKFTNIGLSILLNNHLNKHRYPFTKDQPILTGWEEEIYDVAKKIMEEPSPKQ